MRRFKVAVRLQRTGITLCSLNARVAQHHYLQLFFLLRASPPRCIDSSGALMQLVENTCLSSVTLGVQQPYLWSLHEALNHILV